MKKKILIVYSKSTAEVFNRQSALGSYIHCLSQIFVKNGYDVQINDTPFDQVPAEHTVPAAGVGSSSALKKMVPAFIKEYMKDQKLFRQMEQLLAKIDTGGGFDKILEFYTYGSDLGYRLSKKYNRELVLVYDNPVLEEHSFFYKGQLFFKNKIERLEKQSLLQAGAIVVYSAAVQKYLEKKLNTTLPCFIHQNVDYTRFEFVEEKNTGETINIGFIGSFLKWHRVDLLVNAFTRLRSEGKQVKLFLLGKGMEFQQVKEQVKQNKYAEAIEMPGFADGEQLFNYKKQIDIGVMPGSNWYGAPNKIFEYGAAKMAVVAPGTPTINHLFRDGEELSIFKQDDENELYDKLKAYIEDAALLSRHAAALQSKVRNEYSEKNTFDFYNRLLTP